MKALILAAGFGTRLEESYREYAGVHRSELQQQVEGKPKGLVIIQGKPVVQHQLEQLLQAGFTPDDIFVHTNARYYSQYHAWANSVGIPATHILQNGVMDNEHRLGAVADLQYALQLLINHHHRDDFIIMASDTLLFSDLGIFNLRPLIEQYRKDGISRMLVYEGEAHRLSRHGIVQVDDQRMVIGFEEKPAVPQSNLVNASVQLYTAKMVDAILQGIFEPKADLGMTIAYLYPSFPIKIEKVYRRLDIGTVEDVLQANLPGEFP